MSLPLRRFAASPSLAVGGRGTAPAAWRSQFRGAAGLLPFGAAVSLTNMRNF